MNPFTILKSEQDESVNFVSPADVGMFEARYVRRVPKYFSLYLSSQTGCRQGCRMCHLTASKQTKLLNATPGQYIRQAATVLNYYQQSAPKAEIVHYNFMARGEAFANPWFTENGTEVLTKLGELALSFGLLPRFLVSTILPKEMAGQNLASMFPLVTPEIYYSIYSVRDEFRSKWLPNAMPVEDALAMLREYQDTKRVIPKLHWAFIEGENDSQHDVAEICGAVIRHGLQANLAIVRYNPYSDNLGRESSEAVIDRNKRLMEQMLPGARVKKITRVGMDVKASCGMFVQ